jgi:hypothetical protein
MNTVKEFKAAGLVFEGEDIVSANDNCNVTVKNVFLSLIGHATVKSFAWRTNAGDKPEFNGVMDIGWDDGSVTLASFAHPKFKLSMPAGLRVAKWRPHLAQSKPSKPYDFAEHVSGMFKDIKNTEFKIHEDSEIATPKPVFTQAMADAGEFPPVGSKVNYLRSSGSVVVGPDCDGSFVILDDGEFEVVHQSHLKPIDTRTEKEKAVADMLKCTIRKSTNLTSLKLFDAEMLYDAGYRK